MEENTETCIRGFCITASVAIVIIGFFGILALMQYLGMVS